MKNTWDKKMKELLAAAEASGLDKPASSTVPESEKTAPEAAPKPNYLLPGGVVPEQEPLLPGVGGGPWEPPAGTESVPESETDRALNEALQQLASSIGAGGGSAAAGSIGGAAADRFGVADALRESAVQKSDELYEALAAFAGKQDGRYDALISQISEKGYKDFAGVGDLLAYYAAQGDRAAGNAAANAAADNGGNPDSYAAAQAARKRLDFADAGTEAALGYYNAQLDKWLAAIRAAGADAGDIYGLMQDNVDGTHAAATDEGKLGEALFASLADMENTRAEAEADAFSALLSHYAKLQASGGTGNGTANGGAAGTGSAAGGAGSATNGAGGEAVAISPMEIDQEYELLLNPKNGVYPKYSATEALILLWKKYPQMHEYLLQKYDKVLNPDYEFKD